MMRERFISFLRKQKFPLGGEQGFTLVEVMTTILLFSIIMTAVGNIFVQVMKSQRRGFAGQLVQENVTFALESMAREIRVSKLCSDITCTTEGMSSYDCSTGFSNDLFINHPVNGPVRYTINSNRIMRISAAQGSSTYITSAEVAFTRFHFCVSGGGATDNEQARVAILMKAESVPTTATNKFSVDVQTTVTLRDLSSELQN